MHIFLLAMIQGLTEFLPISSSGHLILFAKYTTYADQGQVIDIALHVGSLIAVVLYFWRTIKTMLVELWQNKFLPNIRADGVKLAYYLIIATVPAIVIGSLMKYVGTEWMRSTRLIGIMLIIYSIILWLADTRFSTQKTLKDMTLFDAVCIGIAQCLAFFPGTSRSGITITMGRFLGYNRSEVAKFSMLLSVPAIFGAGVLAFYEISHGGEISRLIMAYQAVVWSFVFSFLAIFLMMKWLRHGTFLPFVIYRIILGILLLLDSYAIIEVKNNNKTID